MMLVTDWDHLRTLKMGLFDGSFAIFNGIMASAPRQPIWAEVMNYIMFSYQGTGLVIDETGPIALGDCFRRLGLGDESKYPDIYVDRCLLLPQGFGVTNEELKKFNCEAKLPYCQVMWEKGASWQLQSSPFYVQESIKKFHISLLLICLFLLIVLIGGMIYRRYQMLNCTQTSICWKTKYEELLHERRR